MDVLEAQLTNPVIAAEARLGACEADTQAALARYEACLIEEGRARARLESLLDTARLAQGAEEIR